MSVKVYIDGQLVNVVTPADLGCETTDDLAKLCKLASMSLKQHQSALLVHWKRNGTMQVLKERYG